MKEPRTKKKGCRKTKRERQEQKKRLQRNREQQEIYDASREANRTFKKYGDYAEWIVGRALATLQEEKRIAWYKKNDREGIDYDIGLTETTTVYLQVKSSEKSCKDHQKKHRDIPCVSSDRRTRKKDEDNEALQKRLVKEAKKDIVRIFKL
ncbi:MAG: hypothetical protein Q8O83_00430 [bacterium]|nr:hypothetical protein [bacterium]